MDVPLVFSIHLLSSKGLPWHYISEDWCGVKDGLHYVRTDGAKRPVTYMEAWDILSAGKFERFGACEADFVASVSESYLRSDVIPFVGAKLSKKAGFVYDSCEWDEKQIFQRALAENAQEMRELSITGQDRSDLRRYLLTRGLGQASAPVIPEVEVREVVESLSRSVGVNKRSRLVEPFPGDGGLVLTTGRLDRQKGIDVLLKAVPEILEVLPDTKFLFLLIPLLNRELIDSTSREAAEHQENIRVVLGRVPEIYGLAHVSADVYAMPSRWEPFGIAALEAMATGNPVVGTRVGGLAETVLDIPANGKDGTGYLVAPEDHRDLARGLISFLLMMKVDEGIRRGVHQNMQSLLDSIPLDRVRELVARNPSIGSAIRRNCRIRVERHFRPKNAARMAVRAYEKASRASRDRMASI